MPSPHPPAPVLRRACCSVSLRGRPGKGALRELWEEDSQAGHSAKGHRSARRRLWVGRVHVSTISPALPQEGQFQGGPGSQQRLLLTGAGAAQARPLPTRVFWTLLQRPLLLLYNKRVRVSVSSTPPPEFRGDPRSLEELV